MHSGGSKGGVCVWEAGGGAKGIQVYLTHLLYMLLLYQTHFKILLLILLMAFYMFPLFGTWAVKVSSDNPLAINTYSLRYCFIPSRTNVHKN